MASGIDDLQAVVGLLNAAGFELVGGVGEYRQMWRITYVRGAEGSPVSLAQRID